MTRTKTQVSKHRKRLAAIADRSKMSSREHAHNATNKATRKAIEDKRDGPPIRIHHVPSK